MAKETLCLFVWGVETMDSVEVANRGKWELKHSFQPRRGSWGWRIGK